MRRYKSVSKDFGTINFDNWVTPVKFYEFDWELNDGETVTDMNSPFAVSHNINFWVAGAVVTGIGATKVRIRVLSVNSSAQLYMTLFYF